MNEADIEYWIKPDIMWEVMLAQIRGVIIDFAKEKRKEKKDLIKQMNKLKGNTDINVEINIEQLETLNIELETITEERIKGAQIRARSLKQNEGEKPSSYFLSLEKANYINKTMLTK